MEVVIHHPQVALLAIIVGLFGVGRLTRVIVYDDFPPAVWWRIKWAEITHDGPWKKLFTCWWCLSFWVALGCIGWFLLIDVHPFFQYSWWIFWGALALSYAATMIVVRDTPKDQE